MEYHGKHVRPPATAIRPAPYKSFRGRTYAAAVSPESARIMAKLGVGLLIIPQKPWREVEKEVAEYNKLFRELNGIDAPQPISAGWTFVDQSGERARDMAMTYIGGYYRTVLDHYQFAGAHMKNQRGYEYYAKMNDKLAVYGDQKAIEFFADLQVYGTPEQVYDKVLAIHKQTNNSAYVGVFSYAGMAHQEAAPSGPAAPRPTTTIPGGPLIEEGKLSTALPPNTAPDPEPGIGKWTEAAIERAIRTGIDKDGHPLKPPMGYGYYSKISADDMAALIAWLRSPPPKKTP